MRTQLICVVFCSVLSCSFQTLTQSVEAQLGYEQSRQGDQLPTRILKIELRKQQMVDEGRSISQVFLVSEENEIHHRGQAMKITRPRGLADRRLAYLRIYFTGRQGVIHNGVMVLIADFESEQPKFYVDLNNNLDFSDDGKPQMTPGRDSGFVLEIPGDEPDARFAINLIPFRREKNMTSAKIDRFRQMSRGFKNHMGGEFADVEHWYFYQQLNTRTNCVEVDRQKVMIGLHDYDCDGFYSGEQDRLVIGEFGADTISFALADGAVKVAKNALFLIGAQPYRLVEADAAGRFIRIVKANQMPDRLFVGSVVPDIKLRSLKGETTRISGLMEPGKLLVLDFWGHWCSPCVAAIDSSVEFQSKWKEHVVLVGIHSGDHTIAKKLILEKKIPFAQFQSSDAVEEMFFVDAWPSYVVIDSDSKLVSFRSNLKEIARLVTDKK